MFFIVQAILSWVFWNWWLQASSQMQNIIKSGLGFSGPWIAFLLCNLPWVRINLTFLSQGSTVPLTAKSLWCEAGSLWQLWRCTTQTSLQGGTCLGCLLEPSPHSSQPWLVIEAPLTSGLSSSAFSCPLLLFSLLPFTDTTTPHPKRLPHLSWGLLLRGPSWHRVEDHG